MFMTHLDFIAELEWLVRSTFCYYWTIIAAMIGPIPPSVTTGPL